MSWKDLPQPRRTQLEATLTSRQLDVLILHLAGCSQRRIVTMLGISRTTVRDHLTTAIAKLEEPAA